MNKSKMNKQKSCSDNMILIREILTDVVIIILNLKCILITVIVTTSLAILMWMAHIKVEPAVFHTVIPEPWLY